MIESALRPATIPPDLREPRRSVVSAIIRVIVTLLSLILVAVWISATAYWVMVERSEGAPSPLATLRSFVDNAVEIGAGEPASVVGLLAPPVADIQVVWASSATSRAPIGFAGVDLEPRWELEWEVYPVARITRVSEISVFSDYLCAGDAVLSVDGASLNGQTPDAMTRAFEQTVFGKDAFTVVVAPAGGREQLRLLWGPLPVNAQELAGAAVTTTRPACTRG